MNCDDLLYTASSLFSGSKLIVALTDARLKCQWANDRALQCFPTLALPDGVLDLIKGNDIETLIGVLAKGNPYETSVGYEPFNRLNVQFIPIISKNIFCGCIVIFKTFEDHTSDIGKQNIDKHNIENMLAAFSNGYKMPLTIIFSTLGLMVRKVDDNEDETMKSYLRLITQNSYRLLRMSNNLQDISRYRMGAGLLNAKNGDICKYLSGLCSAVSILTESISIPLKTDIPQERILLSFDPNRLSTAILNLVSNACRYTREKNMIRIKLEKMDDQVVITISDKGQGIKKDMLQYVFDPYFAYDPDGRPYGGMGLGLSLVKYIVVQHSGSVAIRSEEGQGTTVAFTLPLSTDENLPDYTAESSTDYLSDRFSELYVEMSDVCRCPLP